MQAADLGEAVISPDSKYALISFITAPLASNREGTYVVFVTDPALAGTVQSFEWTYTENDGTPSVQTTEIGEYTYLPTAEGHLEIQVRLLDSGDNEVGKLNLGQEIGPLNAELETMISEAAANPGAGMGNPDVLREVINDHNPYYLTPVLKVPESGKGFALLLFNTLVDGVMESGQQKRRYLLDQVAAALNDNAQDFTSVIAPGLGVTKMRVVPMAMMLFPGKLTYTELPVTSAENMLADQQLRQQLAALGEEERIDLFNIVRFPKSNIVTCSKLLEAFRDKLFNGVSFDDVLTKMSGVMADWLMKNYVMGPLHRT
jgi:hypothetical protein